ncbi:MAG: MFS transporter [Actinomycetota bacterium]|nr:MFS transporter [Actinomycetota bacterium]
MTTKEVLRYGGVRALLVANGVLFTGVALQATALGLQAYSITGREADLGWIGLCEFLPAALLVLVTGTVADRLDRKKIALVAIAGEVLCGIALLLYATSSPTEVWPLFVIAFFYGVARAFLAPATRPMPAMVAPEGGIPRVVAMYSATWTGATILGPAMSGLLYAWHPAIAYGASTTMIVVAAVLLAGLKFLRQPDRAEAGERPTFRSAIEGLVFVRRTPILLAAIGLDLFAVLFGGAVALLPAIAEQRLGVGQVAYGFLRAAPGVGAALMAVFLAFKPLRRHIGRGLLLAVTVFGVATIVLGVTRSYTLAFVALVILAGADMVSVYIRGSLVPLVTPDEKRGRVMAVENVFIGASNELGAFESGIVAQAVGTPATVIGGGIATIAIAGIWWVAFPPLRNVDRFEDLGH